MSAVFDLRLECEAASDRVAPYVRRTPVEPSPILAGDSNSRLLLKLENLQRMGSFKLRGAVNALRLLSPEERAIAVRLLGYPESSIGRLMTPDFIAVRSDWTVAQSLEHIRRNGQDSETLNVINVVDEQGKLSSSRRSVSCSPPPPPPPADVILENVDEPPFAPFAPEEPAAPPLPIVIGYA